MTTAHEVNAEELTIMDTKRMIALGLTHYYKEKIAGLGDR